MRWNYVWMLVFCFLGTLPLELWLGVRVYRQLGRLFVTLLPVVPLFILWDLYAISQRHWYFDDQQTLGLRTPGDLPIEEIGFFIVVPLAAILTLEAVRKVRGWTMGPSQSGHPQRGFLR